MGEVNKVVYIVVMDGGEHKGDDGEMKDELSSFRYTRSVLQSTLQVMGCKARHAFKISKRVFEIIRDQSSNGLAPRAGGLHELSNTEAKSQAKDNSVAEKDSNSRSLPSELYRMRTTLFVGREKFLDVVCDALSEYKYVGPNQREDLILACRIREKKVSVTVLLCGTSGCGKSTLSSLLGSRLGITTVVSTDSIRHMMRSFVDEKENPLLWASTYHAGDHLDPVAVAEAKAKKNGKSHNLKQDPSSNNTDLISPKQMAIEGFKAQSEMVIESLDRLITAWEERKESVIVEGVHLSLNFVMGLMKKHPSIIPFMIYISNEEKHMERFAVRAKYMTLDPTRNKYVKYIRNIRTIQEYLCNRADKHLVPKINNTNVDKSVATIHATFFSCLRRREAGEQLYDPATNTVHVIHEEYRAQCAAESLNSKGMFKLIQRQGSSRNLMAFFNNDGSVAKVWPVNSVDGNDKPILGRGGDNGIGTPMYGPIQIGKAEPVNLQFGHFALSAWPGDIGCTSHASSVDESRRDGTSAENGSSCLSPSSSMSDGASKELKEELSVSSSDDDIVHPIEVESDEDLTDDEQLMEEEIEGSVDEESTKLDDEYEDLAMQDGQDQKGYWSDHEEEHHVARGDNMSTINNEGNNLARASRDTFTRTKSEPLSEQLCSYSSMLAEKMEKKVTCIGDSRMRKRSLSIPAFSKSKTVVGPILSGAPGR